MGIPYTRYPILALATATLLIASPELPRVNERGIDWMENYACHMRDSSLRGGWPTLYYISQKAIFWRKGRAFNDHAVEGFTPDNFRYHPLLLERAKSSNNKVPEGTWEGILRQISAKDDASSLARAYIDASYKAAQISYFLFEEAIAPPCPPLLEGEAKKVVQTRETSKEQRKKLDADGIDWEAFPILLYLADQRLNHYALLSCWVREEAVRRDTGITKELVKCCSEKLEWRLVRDKCPARSLTLQIMDDTRVDREKAKEYDIASASGSHTPSSLVRVEQSSLHKACGEQKLLA